MSETGEVLATGLDSVVHRAKYLEVENVNDSSQEDARSDDELDEFFIDDDTDESDADECFEDAVDEILTQNVMDCIEESEENKQRNVDGDSRVIVATREIVSELPMTSGDAGLSEENHVQKLLERQRNELALELRKLKMSSRPQETRLQLEQIFTTSDAPLVTNSSSNPTPSTSNYRSEAVQNEILHLTTRRMVSTNLQSSFRQSMERILGERTINATNRTLPNRVSIPPIRESARNSNLIEPNRVQNLTEPNRTPIIRPTLPFLLTQSDNQSHNMVRENLISEISDLVHRELVSSTLQSDFRPRLEANIRSRINRSGLDGNRTRQNIREFIQNTRVTNGMSSIQRNDFSHLGIHSGNANLNDENLDSASSVNSGGQTGRHQRATIVYQNNVREMRDLKNELNEMKKLMQLSLEMQMDMQRSFKQEISALVAGTFHETASTSLVNSTVPYHEGKCIICTESDCDTVLYKCGHMVSCYICSLNLKSKGHTCPVCRAPIEDVVRTFKSSLN